MTSAQTIDVPRGDLQAPELTTPLPRAVSAERAEEDVDARPKRWDFTTMELDPDVQAFKKANRGPIWLWIGGIAAALVLGGLYSVSQSGAVRSELESEGYTEIQVKIKGPFEYTFVAKKAVPNSLGPRRTSDCTGHEKRMPGSSSRDEMCIDTSPPEPPKAPPSPDPEVMAANLQKMFTDKSMKVTAQCPKVDAAATQIVCTVTNGEGAPLEMGLAKDGKEWTVTKPTHIIDRARISADIAKELGQKVKTLTSVDCGLGLLGFEANDHASCTAKRKAPAKDAQIDVTFNETGGYKWTADI